MSKFQLVFGAVVVYVLLLLYVGTVVYMTNAVIKHGQTKPPKDFHDGLVNIVTVIGGLVSALVVARLTITQPGDILGLMGLPADASDKAKMISTFLTWAYLAAWLVIGLVALTVGVLIYPNPTLGAIGTTWLGLAVATTYAYFGIKPSPAP